MTDPQCTVCSAPVPDRGYACAGCGRRMSGWLAEVPGLVDELATSTARLVASGGNGGRRSAETPLPFDAAASTAASALGSTLVGWARHVASERGQPIPRGPAPAEPVSSVAARWLAGHVTWLRHRPEAAEVWASIAEAIATASEAIDTHPADRWYAGPCDCGVDLYARPGAEAVTCRGCGLSWPVAALREWLLASAADAVAHAALISQALTALGRQVTASMVYNWAARGRIVPADRDDLGRPLYRVGDVLRALDDRRKRRAAAPA